MVPVKIPSDQDVTGFQYPKQLLAERTRELQALDKTQPDYASCYRALERAVQELSALLRDGTQENVTDEGEEGFRKNHGGVL